MFEVTVEESFIASHSLKWFNGREEKTHRHRWKVAVSARAVRLDRMGVVADFTLLRESLRKVISVLSRRPINKHPYFEQGKFNPSTENIAKFIYERLSRVLKPKKVLIARVTVWETPTAQACYRRD